MMESPMIERVARVLDPEAWSVWDNGDHFSRINICGRRENSKTKARAAIEAMREPTKDMIDAAYDAYDAYDTAPEPKAWCGLHSAFRAMIDAALNETPATL